MQANWSLMINILLLVGVVVAIGRLMKSRRQSHQAESFQPSLGEVESMADDDIISVRRIDPDFLSATEEGEKTFAQEIQEKLTTVQPSVQERVETKEAPSDTEEGSSIMMFLLAKENRQFAGYDLLQALLASGLRYGDGQLFHRHQYPNGQGPVLCSLAAATASGVFDMQNIGAFSARGLCLFMQASKNQTIDAERFAIMLDTAKQLSESLDCFLLDDQRKPLNDQSIDRYYRVLDLETEMV